MSIQITNDPINQFLDNLPRYALEMRRQDAQREQFNRQMLLREEAEKRAKDRAARERTLFDLLTVEQEYRDKVFRERVDLQQKLRLSAKKNREFAKDNDNLLSDYEDMPDFLKPKTFKKYLERQKTLSILNPKKRENLNKVINDYDDLITNYNPADIKPNEIPIPENLRFNKSLFDFTMDYNFQPARNQLLNNLYEVFGDDKYKVDKADDMFRIQQAEIEGQR